MSTKRRKKTQSFYIFGKNPVFEYLSRNPEQMMRILVSDALPVGEFSRITERAKQERIPVSRVAKKNLTRYVGDVSHQGVIALVRTFPCTELDDFLGALHTEENPLVLVLDHIQDPHNFGAIVRTAVAAGVSGIFIAKDNQASITGTVFKTSAGTILSIPIIRVANLAHAVGKLKKRGFWIASFNLPEEGERESVYWEHQVANDPMVFVFGSEGKGVSDRMKKESDFILSIPMENSVESLNVSVSVAIAVYEWKRQKAQHHH